MRGKKLDVDETEDAKILSPLVIAKSSLDSADPNKPETPANAPVKMAKRAIGSLGEKLTLLPQSAQNRCFGCGPENAIGLQLKFHSNDDGMIVGLGSISNLYEGPTGYLHGGIIATLLDEVMSKTIRNLGVAGMTRTLQIDYLRPVPSDSAIRMEAHLEHREGRKFFTRGKILDAQGSVLASGKALFIEVKKH